MCLKWMEKKIHRLSIWDFGMVKLALILLGMIVGAYISGFVQQYILYLAMVVVVLYAILFYKVFKK